MERKAAKPCVTVLDGWRGDWEVDWGDPLRRVEEKLHREKRSYLRLTSKRI